MSSRKATAAIHSAVKPAARKVVEESVEMIDPASVLLDGFNPRILPIFAAKGIRPEDATQEEIASAIRESRDWKPGRGGFTTSFEDFYNAVVEDGSINEPPVVQRKADGTVVSLHGNNRFLVAKLAKEAGHPGFEMVRCRVLSHDTDPKEVERYMNIAHDPRTKQADWHPAAHAYQLYKLGSVELGGIGRTSARDIVEEYGGSMTTVSKTIKAYSAMQKYMKDHDDQRPLTLWTRFYELQRPGPAAMYANPKTRVILDGLIKADKLNAEDIKYLPDIRENEKAWQDLIDGKGSAHAVSQIKGDRDLDNDFDRIRKTTKLINEIATKPSRAKSIKTDSSKKAAVEELVEALRGLLDKAGMEELLELEPA